MIAFEYEKAREFAIALASGENIDSIKIKPYINIIENELNDIKENCRIVLNQIKNLKSLSL